MKLHGTPLIRIAKAVVPLALMLALPAQAQTPGTVNDFRLPPGDNAQSAPITGPVDPTLPVSTRDVPAPLPPSAPATPPATTEAAPPPIVIPLSPARSADASPPSQPAARAPAAEAAPTALPAPDPSRQPAAAVAPGPPPAASAVPTRRAPSVDPAPARSPSWIMWLLGGALLGLLLAGIGFGWLRRRRSGAGGDIGQTEEAPLPARTARVPTPRARTSPPPVAPGQIELVFEPLSLTMALVNARLAYRLSVKNLGDTVVGPVTIACDIISAHGSLTPGEQLLFEGEMVEPQHRLASLAPGEAVSVTSELQTPIAAIRPICSGDANLFVPLARFHITALGTGSRPFINTRIFVIGERPQLPRERLRPIRIDAGRRTFSPLSHREIESAAYLRAGKTGKTGTGLPDHLRGNRYASHLR